MNTAFETDNWKWSYARFLSAPPGLKAYTVFSIGASLFALLLIFIKEIRQAIVPFTGWSGFSMYMFGLFFTFAILFLKDHKQVNRMRLLFGVAGPLFIYLMIGTAESLGLLNVSYENSYRSISRWQPVWTIILPMLWIVVLFSSRVRRFCQSGYR